MTDIEFLVLTRIHAKNFEYNLSSVYLYSRTYVQISWKNLAYILFLFQ